MIAYITNACCHIIADKYVSYIISRSETANKDPENQSTENETENGFLWESDSDESEVRINTNTKQQYIY